MVGRQTPVRKKMESPSAVRERKATPPPTTKTPADFKSPLLSGPSGADSGDFADYSPPNSRSGSFSGLARTSSDRPTPHATPPPAATTTKRTPTYSFNISTSERDNALSAGSSIDTGDAIDNRPNHWESAQHHRPSALAPSGLFLSVCVGLCACVL